MEKHFDDGARESGLNAQVESPTFNRMRENISIIVGEKAQYVNTEVGRLIDTAVGRWRNFLLIALFSSVF